MMLMSIVTGLGGAFLRADDPKALYAWYEKHLGISAGSGCFTFEAETQRAAIAVSFFPRSSDYFPVSQPAMLNFQVDDLDGLLDQLSSAGVTVDAKREEYEYGRFGWFSDPEGNRVELWQPKVLSASGGAAGDMFSLHSRVALVTGSARGIGRAIAQQLTAAGAVVMLNDLDPEPLEEARAALPGARALAGDLTDPAFPQQLVDAAIGEFGGLDIIVNNAGYTWDNIIQKTTDEQFQAMLDIHIVAPFRILRAAAPFIRDKAKKEAAGGLRVIRKVGQHHLDLGDRWKPGAGGLWIRQSGRDRFDPDDGEGVGPLQRECQRGGIRANWNAPHTASFGRIEDRHQGTRDQGGGTTGGARKGYLVESSGARGNR